MSAANWWVRCCRCRRRFPEWVPCLPWLCRSCTHNVGTDYIRVINVVRWGEIEGPIRLDVEIP